MLEQRPEFQVIGQASDGIEAIEKAERLQPDLILLDIGLPKLNGIRTAEQIRKIAPHSKILFLSQENSPDVMIWAHSATFIKPVPIRTFYLRSNLCWRESNL